MSDNSNGNGNFHISKVLGVGILCTILAGLGKVMYESHQTVIELKAKADRSIEDRKELRQEIDKLYTLLKERKR